MGSYFLKNLFSSINLRITTATNNVGHCFCGDAVWEQTKAELGSTGNITINIGNVTNNYTALVAVAPAGVSETVFLPLDEK